MFYVHGFGSHYDPDHEKIKILEELGSVMGADFEFARGHAAVQESLRNYIIDNTPDLLIGTGIGGHAAAAAGKATGLPFVAMNPLVRPCEQMRQWIGNFTDNSGRDHYLTETVCDMYPDIEVGGYGLILVEYGDPVIRSSETIQLLQEHYRVETFTSGDHGFCHTREALPLIKEFYNQAKASYGTD